MKYSEIVTPDSLTSEEFRIYCILRHMRELKGFRQWWDGIDEKIQDEIFVDLVDVLTVN